MRTLLFFKNRNIHDSYFRREGRVVFEFGLIKQANKAF